MGRGEEGEGGRLAIMTAAVCDKKTVRGERRKRATIRKEGEEKTGKETEKGGGGEGRANSMGRN